MALVVVVLLGVLGFAIGYAIVGGPEGGVLVTGLALGVGAISGVGTYFAGDKFVLAVSGAREVNVTNAPQLMNVVGEMAIAANVPMPKVYVIDHEMSHVRNLDIRFSLIVGVMVGAIAILADFFLRFTFWGGISGRRSGRDSGGTGIQAVIMIVAIVLAILAPIISRFI